MYIKDRQSKNKIGQARSFSTLVLLGGRQVIHIDVEEYLNRMDSDKGLWVTHASGYYGYLLLCLIIGL